ncbi:MAG: SDR family oxidoreductase [Geminicoccaceae bacterium]
MSRPVALATSSSRGISLEAAVAVATPRAEYCVSKAAAAMVPKTWVVCFGPKNIAVYDLQPGPIAIDMTAPVISPYEERTKESVTLFPRIGEAQDIGAIISARCAGKLPDTTGQATSADAGMLVSRF